MRFADAVMVGLFSDDEESAYIEEVSHLENWCQENNPSAHVSKTNKLIVDLPSPQDPRGCGGDGGEIQIPRITTEDLSWHAGVDWSFISQALWVLNQ